MVVYFLHTTIYLHMHFHWPQLTVCVMNDVGCCDLWLLTVTHVHVFAHFVDTNQTLIYMMFTRRLNNVILVNSLLCRDVHHRLTQESAAH